MKRIKLLSVFLISAAMLLAGCGSSSSSSDVSSSSAASGHSVAKDGADMQTNDKTMPTRKPMEGGTKINMYFGDKVIPKVHRYSHDFCGVTQELPYNKSEEHYGWLNGDIDYATDAPYFTILFEDEDVSEKYGNQVNIGVITCPLKEISSLEGDYEVRIELAE